MRLRRLEIKWRRVRARLSQSECAEAVGVTTATWCFWETGKRTPRANKLGEIAALFGCSIDGLYSPAEIIPEEAIQRHGA